MILGVIALTAASAWIFILGRDDYSNAATSPAASNTPGPATTGFLPPASTDLPQTPRATGAQVSPSGPTPRPITTEFRATRRLKDFYDKYENLPDPTGDIAYYRARALDECMLFLGMGADQRIRELPPALAAIPPGDPRQAQVTAYRQKQALCAGFETYRLPDNYRDSLIRDAAAKGNPLAQAANLHLLLLQSPDHWDKAVATARSLLAEPIGETFSYIAAVPAARKPVPLMAGALVRMNHLIDAWELASCEYGGECGENQRWTIDVCAQFGKCGARTYEEYLQTQRYSAADYEEVRRLAGLILDGIRRRDWQAPGLGSLPDGASLTHGPISF